KEKLSEAQKKELAAKYNELGELTAKLKGVDVPDKLRLDALSRVEQLRGELKKMLEQIKPTEHDGAKKALEAEVARMDAALDKLKAETVKVGETAGRDARGRLTRTQYIKMRNRAFAETGAAIVGRGMGALMVIHSVQE